MIQNRFFISMFIVATPLFVTGMHLENGLKGLTDEFGIKALFAFSPETAKPLRDLAQHLLCNNASPVFTRGDRELVASYVSYLNGCEFCCKSHSAIAACLLNNDTHLVEKIRQDPQSAAISPKLKSLLVIAAAVQKGGKNVNKEIIAQARTAGAGDNDIHDTVAIAAAFCMFNRYVDGLAAPLPLDQEVYQKIGQRIVEDGYL